MPWDCNSVFLSGHLSIIVWTESSCNGSGICPRTSVYPALPVTTSTILRQFNHTENHKHTTTHICPVGISSEIGLGIELQLVLVQHCIPTAASGYAQYTTLNYVSALRWKWGRNKLRYRDGKILFVTSMHTLRPSVVNKSIDTHLK